MHIRSAALALAVVAITATAMIANAPPARAQTGSPDVPGHGACSLLPGSEPNVDVSGFSFDTFLLDRASRLVMASTRWQPTAITRPVHATRVRPTVARPRVSQ